MAPLTLAGHRLGIAGLEGGTWGDEALLSVLKGQASNAYNLVRNIPSVEPDVGRLLPGETYFRPWIVEFSLAGGSSSASRNQFFLVAASVRMPFAGPDRVAFAKVVQPTRTAPPGGRFMPIPLAQLLPYTGEPVELAVGVLVLAADPRLQALIDSVTEFSDLIIPPLRDKLSLAEAVENAVDRMTRVGDATLFMGLTHTWASAKGEGIAPGYFALIRAQSGALHHLDLTVRNNALFVRKDDRLTPLAEYDYLLLRVEGLLERDDWKFPNIEQLLEDAIQAIERGDERAFDVTRQMVLTEIFRSPDLTLVDRKRVALAVKEQLDEYRVVREQPDEYRSASGSFSAIGGVRGTDVGSIVAKRGIPASAAIRMSHFDLAAVLAQTPRQ